MKLRMDRLSREAFDVAVGPDTSWAAEAVSRAMDGTVLHIEGQLRVRLVGPGVLVEGQASALVRRRCDRCLASVLLRLDGPFSLFFDPQRLKGDENVRLMSDDLDVGFVHEGELDLGLVLAEHFLLEAPGRIRCDDQAVEREDQGSCEVPGSQPDGEPPVDPRFAALKAFKAAD